MTEGKLLASLRTLPGTPLDAANRFAEALRGVPADHWAGWLAYVLERLDDRDGASYAAIASLEERIAKRRARGRW